jgi:O-antigen/teichoic acid export membrane protein
MEKLKGHAYKLLRWSERYTKTDMIYLASGGFWLTAAQVMSILASLVMAIVFARFLPQETYGTYKYVMSVVGLIGAFSFSGMNTVVTRAVAQGNDKTIFGAFKTNLRWNSLTSLLMAGAGIYYIFHGNGVLFYSLLIAAVTTPLMDSAGLYSSYLNGKRDYKHIAMYSVWSTVIPTIGLIAVSFLASGPVALVAAYFICSTATILTLYYTTLRRYKPAGSADNTSAKKGAHMSVINVIGTIGDQIDNIFVFHALGAIPLAIYSYAVAVPDQAIGLVKNLSTLIMPKFSERSLHEVRSSLPRKIMTLIAVLMPVYVLYAFCAPFIYGFLFPAYIGSIFYSQVYALIIIITASIIPGAVFDSHMAIRAKYWVTIVSNVLRITLMGVGVIYWGIMGVIVAQVITKTFTFCITIYAVKRLK